MRRYVVYTICPKCDQRHELVDWLTLESGPTEEGSLSELYRGEDMPKKLVELLEEEHWCEKAGAMQKLDAECVYLQPWPAFPTDGG